MENIQQKKSRLQQLLESFDKKYIEELFLEGLKEGVHNPNNKRNWYQYDYNGYRYTINRVDLRVLAQVQLEEMQNRANILRKDWKNV
ncbi:MAG TPA: hypothetical protein VGB37_00380 [Candidatus Lokiarchaeia archaeon]